MREHAADLAMAVSIVSSLRNLGLPRDTAFIGEVGLSGEIRHVTHLSRRISECEKMGIRRVFVPKTSLERGTSYGIQVEGMNTLSDVLARAF